MLRDIRYFSHASLENFFFGVNGAACPGFGEPFGAEVESSLDQIMDSAQRPFLRS